MLIAAYDFDGGRHGYIAAALTAHGLHVKPVGLRDDASGCETALLLVASVDAAALDFIAELRARRPAIHQLVISDHDDVDARIAAYDAGADDCLSKPFHLRELLAKLRALGRRSLLGAIVPLMPGSNVVVDQVALELRVGAKATSLTKREADLFVLLARASGAPVRREDILREAWNAAPGLTCNLVDVYVGYARRKLCDLGAGVIVKAVRGEGFRFASRDEDHVRHALAQDSKDNIRVPH